VAIPQSVPGTLLGFGIVGRSRCGLSFFLSVARNLDVPPILGLRLGEFRRRLKTAKRLLNEPGKCDGGAIVELCAHDLDSDG
jgi:hypothetical protein